mmetsp:Transcript_93046/g.170740  ORF Transcript_93046/g.170740 Transcript_93046/m.170740 type:complete len:97 (+) Transcript_93046:42-332(+)
MSGLKSDETHSAISSFEFEDARQDVKTQSWSQRQVSGGSRGTFHSETDYRLMVTSSLISMLSTSNVIDDQRVGESEAAKSVPPGLLTVPQAVTALL